MSNNYIFDLYKLSEYSAPDYYEVSFVGFYQECLQVLQNRTEQEIAKVLLDIDLYQVNKELDGAENRLDLYELTTAMKNLSHENIDLLFSREVYPSRRQIVSILHLMASGGEPDILSDVQGLKWDECIAVALLGHVMFAFDRDKKLAGKDFSENTNNDFYYDLGEYLGTFAMTCVEISCLLASLPSRKVGGYSLPNRALYSAKARKAANAKNAPSKEIKERFVEWYLINKDSFKSQVDAVSEYMANMMTEAERDVVGSPKTLEGALRAARKVAK